MYELIKLTENTGYITSPAKIGVIKRNNRAYLIDSGNDKDAGKKILRILEAQNLTLEAIFNTHSNADHIGGCAYLFEKTGCKIFAPGIECAMTRHTILEPSFLFGGYPPKELRHKFLYAKESPCEYLIEGSLPEGVSAVELPGHFFDMTGYMTDDGVFFIADCLGSYETLDKYKIPFIYDIKAYLETLDKVRNTGASIFVPSHAPHTDDISPLCEYNKKCTLEVAEKITELLSSPMSFERILARLFNDYGLVMTHEQHALVGSTVRSYLSYLSDGEKIRPFFDKNILLYERV